MFKAIKIIAGWFGVDGAIATFFAWLGVKFTSKALIVGTQIGTIIILFATRAAFLIAVIHFAKLTLNFLTVFFNSIPSMLTADNILSTAYLFMQSIGLISAFTDAFSLFNTLFISLLTAWALKFAYHTSKMTSDEFFKLGMLLQV